MRGLSNAQRSEAFSPMCIRGIDLWLEADFGCLKAGAVNQAYEGDAVAQWSDRSGNNNHALQATAAKQPLFKSRVFGNKPGLLFDGVDDDMLVTINAQASSTIFIVLKDVAAVETGRYVQITTNGTHAFKHGTAIGLFANQAGAAVDYTGSVAASASILTLNMASNASLTMYLNGVAQAAIDPNDAFAAGPNLRIGSEAGSSLWANFYIGALIRANSSLISFDQRRIETYLAHKNTIAVS